VLWTGPIVKRRLLAREKGRGQTAGELPLADLLPLISRRWFLVTSVVKVLRW
jgi:hypothetical protein